MTTVVPTRASGADRREEAAPHVPEPLVLRLHRGERDRLEHRDPREERGRGVGGPGQAGGIRRAHLDEQRAGGGRERPEHRRQPGLRLDGAERGTIHHLHRRDRTAREPLRRARRGLDVGEEDEGARLVRVLLDGREGHLGDEGERPLRADDEVQEDVDRVLEVEEGVEPVARWCS